MLSPEMIRQEIWAFLLTNYAIRYLMCEAADQAGKDPDRLSFMRSLRVIRRQVTDQAALPPCRLANSLTATFTEILEKLNPPRQNRSSLRVVKRVHVHAYRAKRSGDTATLYPAPPNIRILAVA
jgi:hypothetical protein